MGKPVGDPPGTISKLNIKAKASIKRPQVMRKRIGQDIVKIDADLHP
jgi:hypothetical protein